MNTGTPRRLLAVAAAFAFTFAVLPTPEAAATTGTTAIDEFATFSFTFADLRSVGSSGYSFPDFGVVGRTRAATATVQALGGPDSELIAGYAGGNLNLDAEDGIDGLVTVVYSAGRTGLGLDMTDAGGLRVEQSGVTGTLTAAITDDFGHTASATQTFNSPAPDGFIDFPFGSFTGLGQVDIVDVNSITITADPVAGASLSIDQVATISPIAMNTRIWQSLDGIVRATPAAVSDGTNVDAFIVGDDGAIWTRSSDGTQWSAWASLGGASSSAPVAVVDGGDTYVVVEDGAHGVWYRQQHNGTWSGWLPLGGTLAADDVPVAVAGPQGLTVFGRTDDGSVWYRRLASGAWSPWLPLGGQIFDISGVATDGDTRVLGIATGGELWQRVLTSSGWTAWTPLGGVLGSRPAAVFDGSRLFVFATGGDSAAWYRAFDGGTWSPWLSLGGVYGCCDLVATSGPTGIFVFGAGTDDSRIWYRRLQNDTWTPISTIEGSAPLGFAAVGGPTDATVFVEGVDARLWFLNM